MHGNHLRHLLIGGGLLLGVLRIAGVPLSSALPYAAAQAGPLMMIFMMSSMGAHGAGCHGGHDDQPAGREHGAHREASQPGQVEQTPDGTAGVPRS